MTRSAMSYNELSHDHGTSSQVDLSAIFSSLEIVTPKQSSATMPIDEEQGQILINALRNSLNLGASVDDTLFKEMAEAMMRCKLRCMAYEKDETIEKMSQMHIQVENKNQHNRDTSKAQTAGDVGLSEKNGRNASIDSSTPNRIETSTRPIFHDCTEFFKVPLPPDSPWPPTAQKVYPECMENRNEVANASSVKYFPETHNRNDDDTTLKPSSTSESTHCFSAQASSSPLPTHSLTTNSYTPAPNITEDHQDFFTKDFIAPALASSSIPYTPLPNAEEFQKAIFHAQQGVNELDDDVALNIKTPTFLFKSSGITSDTNTKANPDETTQLSDKKNEASTVRTVRFEVGTKVSCLSRLIVSI
jgi:hypothetical protein